MSQLYCTTCDSYFYSEEQDHADYSGEHPVCGDCVDELEEQQSQFQAWQAAIDADTDYINEVSK